MKNRTDRTLLLGFVLGVAACIAACMTDISFLFFTTVLPFFCAQLLMLRKTKKPWLRLLPVYPVVLLLLAAGYYWMFGKGWDALAALIFALASIAPAAGCLLALLTHHFSGKALRRQRLIVCLVVLGCLAAWWGQEIALGYWYRAFLKLLGFGLCMGVYGLLTTSSVSFADSSPARGEPSIFSPPDRKSLKTAGILALAVFLFLTVAYMLLAPWLDLSAIPEKLRYNDVTAENFPLIAAYITLGNSLLEELFFRGFAFLTLRNYTSEKFAYFFSALAFALYHVSILDGWFHPVWFGLFLVGLAVGGLIFNFLGRKGSLWCGWLVHMAADAAIMLIGMRMFGIL